MNNIIEEPGISEIEEHEYMQDSVKDLNSEYMNYKKYNEEKDYIEENLWTKVERLGRKLSFANDIKALYNYFTDSSIPWYRKSIVIGALIYFITPIDTIPDIAPLIGYLDDLGVITAVIKYMGSELIPFYD